MKRPISILLISYIMILTACQDHKDILCPGQEPHRVDISFEWDKASEANPDGMTLYFYSDNGESYRFDIAGREGGPVELPVGQYHMVAYNNDVPTIDISDAQSFQTIKAEARHIKGKNFLSSAGMLYETTINRIEVTPCGVEYTREDGTVKECNQSLIRCHPDSITSIYSLVVNNVSGIGNVKKASATIKGIASGQYLSDHHPFGVSSESYFPLSVDISNGMFTGKGGAFPSNGKDMTYSLDIIVTLTDGTSYVKDFDITQQVVNSKYPHNVLIVINGLGIPDSGKPSPPGGGDISVDVEGWEVIEIDINSDISI